MNCVWPFTLQIFKVSKLHFNIIISNVFVLFFSIQATPGRPGSDGVKGERGLPGLPGQDGRSGIPGSPGLGVKVCSLSHFLVVRKITLKTSCILSSKLQWHLLIRKKTGNLGMWFLLPHLQGVLCVTSVQWSMSWACMIQHDQCFISCSSNVVT